MPTDEREVLRSEAYADASKLRARQALWTYVESGPTSGRIGGSVSLVGNETVVDIGCGNGLDLARLRADGHEGQLVAIDFSLGMLASVSPTLGMRLVADATAIPLADASADVVCAMHMLYHLTDIAAALRDAHRILRPDGYFLASTNSETSAAELTRPWSAAMVAAGGPPLPEVPQASPFTTENGSEFLEAVFSSVELKADQAVARVPSAEVVRAYVASTDDLCLPLMPNQTAWSQVLDAVTELAQQQIDMTGSFDVIAKAGVFVARK